ncbi:MAG: helix-turn-helix domain-containing protein, partial [Geminicoccales bacterium]
MLRSTQGQDRLDPAETLIRELGAHLRQVRLERGEDLDEIAQQLRIKPAYLAGIEEGDLSMLPGRTYALGFLRTYAEHLGFDGNDLVVRIKASVGELTDRTRLRIRTPMPESRLPKTPIIVLSLVVVAAIYAGWSYRDRSPPAVVETVAKMPAELRADDPETRPDVPQAPAEPGNADGGAALAP